MNNNGHILIIDDEAALRHTLARILQNAGFEVTTAENGEQGLTFTQSANFDMVFMDYLCGTLPNFFGLRNYGFQAHSDYCS